MVNPGMTLAELLGTEVVPKALQGIRPTGLCLDSRRVRPGDAFLACPGEQSNGARFIQAAAECGAAVVLVDSACGEYPEVSVPLLEINGLKEQLSTLGRRFYGHPAAQLRLIGITGTNGKTSCSHFLSRALTSLGSATTALGTNGYGFVDHLHQASHTTPDLIGLQQMLAVMASEGARNVAMEVSSHALDQGRIQGLAFEYGIFTNLTRDHLDYHRTMEAYAQAKWRLFHDYPVKRAIINLDDPWGAQLSASLKNCLTYSIQRSDADVRVQQCSFNSQGIAAEILTPWGALQVQTQLYGAFNLHNLLAVIAVLGAEGYAPEAIAGAIAELPPVEGRMQRFGGTEQPLVVIDYAHTPDALEKALAGLRQHVTGKLWCVFGCGGDRDRGKRPLMGAVAGQYADAVVITSDNPRNESPVAIIDEVLAGISKVDDVQVEQDRSVAIRRVIDEASSDDLILIAGKGHEDYQEVAGTRHHFSDAEQVRAALADREVRA